MKKRRLLLAIVPVMLGLLIMSGVVLARGPADPSAAPATQATVGTGFTYKGRLDQGGTSVSGTCDFEFKLFDAATGVTQIGSPVPQNNVTVTDGQFTVLPDFGPGTFSGTERYLELAVRCLADPIDTLPFTKLSPRQELTATPYATQASSAASAPRTGLTNVPGGFADGVDDDTKYTPGAGLILTGDQFSIDTDVILQRVSGECSSGNAIRVIASDGNVTCESVSTTLLGHLGTLRTDPVRVNIQEPAAGVPKLGATGWVGLRGLLTK